MVLFTMFAHQGLHYNCTCITSDLYGKLLIRLMEQKNVHIRTFKHSLVSKLTCVSDAEQKRLVSIHLRLSLAVGYG